MAVFGTPTYAGSSTSTTSLTIGAPSGISNGDYVIVAIRSQDGSGAKPWTAPSGFTLVTAAPELPDPGVRVAGIFAKRIEDASTEPTTYTFSGPTGRAVAVSVTYTPDIPGDFSSAGAVPYGGGVAPVNGISTIPQRSLDAFPAVGLVAVGAEATSGKSGYPTNTGGFTEIGHAQSSLDSSTSGSRTVIWLGYREENDSTMDSFSIGYSGVGSIGVYYGAVQGGADDIPAPSDPPAGFRSVAQMLSTPGATWAHRGGSTTWPEMSEMAYRNSALAGYGALEFSAARTSDGVWFGLHDASINRTSGTTGLPDASAMTWAEVQAYRNTNNGGNEPYYRLDDFLADYGQTHVVIVDCKYAVGHLDEFFTKLSVADRKRVVVKAFGTMFDGPNIASRVRTNGYSSWGYYYPAQVADGTLATTQKNWSILGMDYTGTQADWDAIISYGKPVTGHICPTVSAYNTAITKGARMVQCSGVAVIPAVGSRPTSQVFDAVYTGSSRIPSGSVYVGTQIIWP